MAASSPFQELIHKAINAGVRGGVVLRTTSSGRPVYRPNKGRYGRMVGKVVKDGDLLGSGTPEQRRALGMACLEDCPSYDAQDHEEAQQAHLAAAEGLAVGSDYDRRMAAMHYVAVVGHKAAALQMVAQTPEAQEKRRHDRLLAVHNRRLAAQAENVPSYLRDIFWQANKRQF